MDKLLDGEFQLQKPLWYRKIGPYKTTKEESNMMNNLDAKPHNGCNRWTGWKKVHFEGVFETQPDKISMASVY